MGVIFQRAGLPRPYACLLLALALLALDARAVRGQEEVPNMTALTRQLAEGTVAAREAAAAALADSLAETAAVNALLGALSDVAPSVRMRAMTALGGSDDSRVPTALAVVARDNYPAVRQAATLTLGRMNGTRSLDALIGLAGDRQYDDRAGAVQALCFRYQTLYEQGLPQAARVRDLLLAFAADQNPSLRAAVCARAGCLSEADGRSLLAQALRDGDVGVRAAALAAGVALPELAEDLHLTEAIATAARATEPLLRARAYEAAGLLADPQFAPACATGLADADALAAGAAERALARLVETGAVSISLPAVLKSALAHPSASTRLRAIRLLRLNGGSELAAQARPFLDDQDESVRLEALQVFETTADPAATPALLRLSRSPDPGECLAALRALAGSREPAALEPLLAIAGGADPADRLAALPLLARYDDPRAIELLCARAIDAACPAAERAAAAAALASSAAVPAVLDRLLRALQDADAAPRAAAARSLGGVHEPRVIDALLQHLDDDPAVIAAAAAALGRCGDARAVRPLWHALSRPAPASAQPALLDALDGFRGKLIAELAAALAGADAAEQAAAVRVLCLFPDARAVSALLPLLQDGRAEIRRDAVCILGSTDDARLREAMQGAFRDRDPAVRAAAVRVLGQSGDAGVVPVLREALDDLNPEVRRLALEAVGRMRDAESVPRVATLLATGAPSLFRDACLALARIGTPGALEALDGALFPPSSRLAPDVVAGMLREASRSEAVPLQLKGLQHPARVVRLTAIEMLGRITNPRASDALLQAAKDPDCPVREAALCALARMGGDGAASAVYQAMQDPVPEVGRLALQLLAAMHDPRAFVLAQTRLKFPDQALRLAAIRAVAASGDPGAAEALFAVVSDVTARHADRREAVLGLGQLHDARAVAYLLTAVRKPRGSLARELGLLAGSDDPRIDDVLLGVLEDESARVPATRMGETALALAMRCETRAVPLLVKALNVPAHLPAGDLEQIIDALGRLRDPRAVEPLLAALQDGSPVQRALLRSDTTVCGQPALRHAGVPPVLSALAAIGDARAIGPLVPMVGWGTLPERAAAAAALAALGGANFGLDAGRWQAWWDARARKE